MDSVRAIDGGKIWENGIETCKISCMKRVASPGSMHDTGYLGLVHWGCPCMTPPLPPLSSMRNLRYKNYFGKQSAGLVH